MKNLNSDCYNPFFSHIYIEKELLYHPRAKRVLERFSDRRIIEISHYKDVFCRRGQDIVSQSRSQKLILAKKQGTLVYPGAPVCQNFGNAHFYYTSLVMNCIYGCEYCYLNGMYPSANIVLFVNLEDYFDQINRMLCRHPVYLCVSYDTDLLALEGLAGYAAEWVRFAGDKKGFTMEIRTKSADRAFFQNVQPKEGVIYAFTLSPQAVIDAFEHGTPSLKKRIACVKEAVQRGFSVRLCFDPMIYMPDWQTHYDAMLSQIFEAVSAEGILDASIGSFRVPQDYLKRMRKQSPESAVVQFPFQNSGGVYQYPDVLACQMEGYLKGQLSQWLRAEQLFFWEKG